MNIKEKLSAMNIKEKLGEVTKQSVFIARAALGAVVSRIRWALLTSKGRRLTSGLVVVGTVALAAASRPVTLIEPGQLAIRMNLVTGNSTELREGWALLVPYIHRLHLYSLKDQVYRPERSLKANGPAPFQSEEGLSIGIEITLRYALDADRVASLATSMPEDVGREIVEPVIDGVLRRHFSQHTVREIFATERKNIQQALFDEIAPLLAKDGVILRSITLGNVDLPAQYRNGVEALLAEELSSQKMKYTLELKEQQIQETALSAEAEKVRREKAAEASASEEIIAAKAKAEAMRHILPFKEKEIEQRRLEAEAAKVSRITQAQGEADARRKLAESDAYRVEVTGKASSEQLAREADLITKNPLLIQKTLADKLSDKIQVIIAPPQMGGFVAGNLLGQGQPQFASAPGSHRSGSGSESESGSESGYGSEDTQQQGE